MMIAMYRPDPREIKARLDLPLYQKLFSMGYQRDHIRKAIERRLTSVGDDFSGVEELIRDILSVEGDSALPINSAYSNDLYNNCTNLKENTSSQMSRAIGQDSSASNSHNGTTQTKEPARNQESTVDNSAVRNPLPTGANSITENTSAAASTAVITPTSKDNHEKKICSNKESKENTKDADTFEDEKDLEELQREYEELKKMQTCKICLDEESDVVFLPCGHLVCCQSCSPQISHCCICRSLIRGTVKSLVFQNWLPKE